MSWEERRRAIGRLLDRVGLKSPLNTLRFSLQRPPWWLEQRARRRFFRRFIPRRSLCFDLGANDGRSAALFLELGARVLSVEPQPDCVARARERLGGNRRWSGVQAALSDAPGKATLWEDPDETQIASLEPAWIEAVQRSGRFAAHRWSRQRPVPVTTLDALIQDAGLPHFCKIDVEGSEPAVLRGLTRAIPVISFEWTPEFDSLDACLERLEQLGEYRYQLARHDEWACVFDEARRAPAFREALIATPGLEGGGDVYALLQ